MVNETELDYIKRNEVELAPINEVEAEFAHIKKRKAKFALINEVEAAQIKRIVKRIEGVIKIAYLVEECNIQTMLNLYDSLIHDIIICNENECDIFDDRMMCALYEEIIKNPEIPFVYYKYFVQIVNAQLLIASGSSWTWNE